MLSMLLKLLIPVGICMLICGLSFKILKTPKGAGNTKCTNANTVLNILEKVTSNRILSKMLEFITRNKTLWANKFALRILELSEIGLSLQQLYALKIACFIISTLLILIIGYTNAGYESRIIIEAAETPKSILDWNNAYDASRYGLYKQVLSQAGKNNLSNVNERDRYLLVEKEMAECLNTSDKQLIQEKTVWFIKTWQKLQGVEVFSYSHILIMLCSLLLPEFLLILRWLLRGCVYKKEIIKLEYIFELLARIDGIKTLDIIHELEKSSKIYAKYLNEFIKIFRYDKKRGFEYLQSRNIKCLSKLADVIEIYSLSDKKIALQVLEREVIERDESMIITADETIDFIDLVAFVSIVPLVYELAKLMLNPMLDIVYKAFEFI